MVKYLVQSTTESEVGPSSSVRSAFEVMMVARKVVRLPAAMEGTLSKKDNFHNHVGAWLEKQELGCTSDVVDSSGKAFINMLTDVFWCIDSHHGSLDGSTSKRTKDC